VKTENVVAETAILSPRKHNESLGPYRRSGHALYTNRVFRHLNGRETDHLFAVRLRGVDLASQEVKPHSPSFPGTILERDRWDSQPDHHALAFVEHFYLWNHSVSIVTPDTLLKSVNSGSFDTQQRINIVFVPARIWDFRTRFWRNRSDQTSRCSDCFSNIGR